MQRKSIGKHISILYRYSGIWLDKFDKHVDVNSASVSILAYLYRNEGVSQHEVANELSIDKGSITRNINKLIKSGYVIRKSNPIDKRAYKLYVTKKARNTEKRFFNVLDEWTSALLVNFNEEEKEIAFNLLNRMSENAKKAIKDLLNE